MQSHMIKTQINRHEEECTIVGRLGMGFHTNLGEENIKVL